MRPWRRLCSRPSTKTSTPGSMSSSRCLKNPPSRYGGWTSGISPPSRKRKNALITSLHMERLTLRLAGRTFLPQKCGASAAALSGHQVQKPALEPPASCLLECRRTVGPAASYHKKQTQKKHWAEAIQRLRRPTTRSIDPARIYLAKRLERSRVMLESRKRDFKTNFLEGSARSIVENLYAFRRITSVMGQSRLEIANMNLEFVPIRIQEIN